VHVAKDKQGRGRVAFAMTAKQLLMLRGRSSERVRAMSFVDYRETAPSPQ
jgi:hypothetical protein